MKLPIPFIHRWRPLFYGWHQMTARECTWCGRFEVYVFGSWTQAPRSQFPDARPHSPPT